MLNSSTEAVAGGADAASVVSAGVRAVAGATDAGFGFSEATNAFCGGVSCSDESGDRVRRAVVVVISVVSVVVEVVVPAASSVRGDDVFRAFVDALRSPLRNRRHVSELCSDAVVLGPTAGFAPSALLVSSSSCPVMVHPLRI